MPPKDSNEAADVTLLLRVDATKATFYGCAKSLTFGKHGSVACLSCQSIAIHSRIGICNSNLIILPHKSMWIETVI